MSEKKVHYKKALRKQIWTIAIVSITFMVFTFTMSGKSDLHFYMWLILFPIVSYVVFALLKKQSKEVLCPYCKADLYEAIELANMRKLEFNYCPSCGNKIEL